MIYFLFILRVTFVQVTLNLLYGLRSIHFIFFILVFVFMSPWCSFLRSFVTAWLSRRFRRRVIWIGIISRNIRWCWSRRIYRCIWLACWIWFQKLDGQTAIDPLYIIHSFICSKVLDKNKKFFLHPNPLRVILIELITILKKIMIKL